MGNLTGSINKPMSTRPFKYHRTMSIYADNQSLSVMLNIFGGFFFLSKYYYDKKLLIRKHSLAVMLLKIRQSLSPY